MRQGSGLTPLWVQNHYTVRLAKVQYVGFLNIWCDGMDNQVVSNVESSMGIAPVVWDELAVQVLVVATQENVPWPDEVHYPLQVVPSDIVGVWVICQYGEEAEGQNLDLPKLCQELRPNLV